MSAYFPILILLVFAVLLGLMLLGLSRWITRHWIHPSRAPRKYDIYESGINPLHDARLRFSIRFYLIAMLFIVFDVEVVFFYPWAVVFREMVRENLIIFWEMAVFVGILVLGYLYLWRKGGLDWD